MREDARGRRAISPWRHQPRRTAGARSLPRLPHYSLPVSAPQETIRLLMERRGDSFSGDGPEKRHHVPHQVGSFWKLCASLRACTATTTSRHRLPPGPGPRPSPPRSRREPPRPSRTPRPRDGSQHHLHAASPGAPPGGDGGRAGGRRLRARLPRRWGSGSSCPM